MMLGISAQRVRGGNVASELPPPGAHPGSYPANDPAISYSDCVAPTFVNGWARFQRPIADPGSDYQYCMPGARHRFMSNAPSVSVQLRWNGLVTRTDARNLIGHVFVDGVFVQDFQTPAGINVVTTGAVVITMGSSTNRLYEIILPYADGVEFGGVEVDPTYVVTAAPPRTGPLMVCLGDSITQGFLSTDTRRSWPFLLAQAKGFRCINLGYGGRQTVPSDGTAAANLNPDRITVLLGMNDFLGQRPVADYKADLKQLLMNIHAVAPTVPVYVAGVTLSTTVLSIPYANYKAVAGQVISELGYSQLVGVNTATLIPDASKLMPDGVHPNDAGEASMAAGWGAVIS